MKHPLLPPSPASQNDRISAALPRTDPKSLIRTMILVPFTGYFHSFSNTDHTLPRNNEPMSTLSYSLLTKNSEAKTSRKLLDSLGFCSQLFLCPTCWPVVCLSPSFARLLHPLNSATWVLHQSCRTTEANGC
jgi:hypothetical protein